VTEAAPESFGGLLRAFRESAGLSQEELAERAGISSHAVSALERGTRTRPYPHTVRALADALSLSEDQRATLIASVPARRRPHLDPAGPAGPDTPDRGWSLPRPATPLVGRDDDIARVAGLVRDPDRRLVTLTGTGGVGKTRLGLAAADAVAPAFSDGVRLVELAPVSSGDAVLPAIVDSIDATAASDRDPLSSIVEALADRQVLILLDNLEHLLESAPQIAQLIDTAPGLTVLATSRAPLRIRSESEFLVEPLALPPDTSSRAVVHASPAVRLLLDRTRATSPGWGDADDDVEAVAGICVRLAGIPLALELTAARARLLDPTTLLARLDHVAADSARDLPERQRTMSAALDWSYGLLAPGEQTLLRLLSVFAGGFRLDDLEAVVGRCGPIRPADVLPLLQSLAEQSLVVRASEAGAPLRHRLLEPVAQYARHKLDEAGEQEAAFGAHADHFLALAEQAAPQYQRAEQVTWLGRIDAEHPNLTAAIERCLAAEQSDKAARFGWSLWLYWWLRGHLVHGRRLMETILDTHLPTDLRARAELAAATMAFAMDDIEASRRWWTAAAEHAEASSDVVSQANAVAGVGLAALASGKLAAAEQHFEATLPLAAAGGSDSEWTAALTQIWLGTVRLLTGDPDSAVEHIDHGLASARRRGDRLTWYIALYNLAQVEMTRSRPDLARGHLAEGMRLSLETGDTANLAYLLDALAVLEAAEDVYARVPLLIGAAQAIRETIGAHGYGYYRPDPEAGAKAVDEARRLLGDDRYDDALDVGRTLPPDEAVRLALGERTGTG
jgi:predicted ATPase/transcriptional regulator with XRE-family HTH domain